MATTKLKGNEVTLSGTELKVGDIAPVVTVVAKDLSDVQVGGQKVQQKLENSMRQQLKLKMQK